MKQDYQKIIEDAIDGKNIYNLFMVETFVSTLPMDPKRSDEFFLFTTPFISHLVAKATGRSLILPINRVGTETSPIDSYIQGVSALGIYPYKLTFDNNPNFLEFVTDLVYKQYKLGEVVINQESIMRCQCGVVEMLSRATDKIEKRTNGKTFKVRADKALICKKCNTVASSSLETCLLSHLPANRLNPGNVQPKWYQLPVQEELSRYFNSPHLISRQRETSVQVTLAGMNFNLDNDYVWLNYGRYCNENLENPQPTDVIVASNHSLRKGAVYATLAGYSKDMPINLVLTPYITFREKSTRLSTLSLISLYSQITLRAFMLAYLNWYAQNTYADPIQLRWINRMTQLIEITPPQHIDMENITNKIRGHTLRTGLNNLRHTNSLSDDQKLVLAMVNT